MSFAIIQELANDQARLQSNPFRRIAAASGRPPSHDQDCGIAGPALLQNECREWIWLATALPKPSFGKRAAADDASFRHHLMKEVAMQVTRYVVYGSVGFNVLLAAWLSLYMLYDPEGWYYFVPGVTGTGMYNQHFIRDIGLIQGFIAIAFVIGAWKPSRRLELWAAATLWLIAHAMFHLWEVAVGICSSSVLLRDFPGVSLPAILGIVATLWAARQAISYSLEKDAPLRA